MARAVVSEVLSKGMSPRKFYYQGLTRFRCTWKNVQWVLMLCTNQSLDVLFSEENARDS